MNASLRPSFSSTRPRLPRFLATLVSVVLLLIPTARGAEPPLTLQGLFPATIDYRPQQSPVKFQADRGTCTAFSVAAMMETFDGVPSDLSEQAAYGYIKLKQFGQGKIGHGGLLVYYAEYLSKMGFIHETIAPYDPKAGLWSKDDNLLKQYLEEGKTGIADLLKQVGTTHFRAEPDQITYLEDDAAADVLAIKRLLVTGHRAIAVGYNTLYVPYWSRYKSGLIIPDDGMLYQIGEHKYALTAARALRPKLVDDILAGEVKVLRSKPEAKDDYGGHAVTIVGYTTNGFIIKNSWSTNWGMQGYGVVSFDYHRLFCDEALAVREAAVYVSPGDTQVRPTIYLKGRPTGVGASAALRLSLFGPKEGGLPDMRNLRYEIYEQTPEGLRGKLVGMPPPGELTATGVGHPVDVLRGQNGSPSQSGTKYWVQISFANGPELIERIVTFPNVVWANREYRGL